MIKKGTQQDMTATRKCGILTSWAVIACFPYTQGASDCPDLVRRQFDTNYTNNSTGRYSLHILKLVGVSVQHRHARVDVTVVKTSTVTIADGQFKNTITFTGKGEHPHERH